jgi:hypothetical protein
MWTSHPQPLVYNWSYSSTYPAATLPVLHVDNHWRLFFGVHPSGGWTLWPRSASSPSLVSSSSISRDAARTSARVRP